MSLKEKIPEIFTRYGLSEEEFLIYVVYLGLPQATQGEVAYILNREDPETITKATEHLVQLKFLKKLPGVIDRYLALEPYFELFNKESRNFREEIGKIKDTVLGDQSKRFERLENIEKKAVGLIDQSVEKQVNDFFTDTDKHDTDKQSVISTANVRFNDTSKELENSIQKTTYTARDRFTTNGKQLENDLQGIMFQGRDRYESTSKELEANLHQHVDDIFLKLKNTTNARDADSKKVWDANTQKFTGDNSQLNSDLDQITTTHNQQSKTLEVNLHKVTDDLNKTLKSIADEFKMQYDNGIQGQKGSLDHIIDDLLNDITQRLSQLEIECKKDLDAHVDHHKEHAEALKPKMDEILEKYILRMKKVVDDLKNLFSKLLSEQMEHVYNTSNKLQNQLNERLEARQTQLTDQVKSFEKNTVILVDNLKDISDKLTELGSILASRGSAWKALLLNRHKVWRERYDEIAERITKISGTVKEDFALSTSKYTEETNTTKTALQAEITEITNKENENLKSETTALDKNQKETLSAELEGLAGDLSNETDATIAHNIKHCQDTTVKLKDSLENTLHTHKGDYDVAINRHRQVGLTHYDTSNSDVKKNVDGWYASMDSEQQEAKENIDHEVATQISDTNNHLNKTKEKNVTHSQKFERDVKQVEENQRQIYDELLKVSLDDVTGCKTNISDKINGEITLIKNETQQMDEQQHQQIDQEIKLFTEEIGRVDNEQHKSIDDQIALFNSECNAMEEKLHKMLDVHKTQYKDNATSLQQSLTTTVKDNVQSVKDAIADFTLNFMNAIDEATEKSQNNEEKLLTIVNAAANVEKIEAFTTWHVVGREPLISAICDTMWRTKSSIIIVTPNVEEKVLEHLSQAAYKKKNARFFYTTNWDLQTWGPVLNKMKALGNIQFRNLKTTGEFYAVARDAEEVILGPNAKDPKDLVSIVSTQEGYCQLYSAFIGPIFQANSRPI